MAGETLQSIKKAKNSIQTAQRTWHWTSSPTRADALRSSRGSNSSSSSNEDQELLTASMAGKSDTVSVSDVWTKFVWNLIQEYKKSVAQHVSTQRVMAMEEMLFPRSTVDIFVSSDRSYYSDDGLLYIYLSAAATFSDFHSVP